MLCPLRGNQVPLEKRDFQPAYYVISNSIEMEIAQQMNFHMKDGFHKDAFLWMVTEDEHLKYTLKIALYEGSKNKAMVSEAMRMSGIKTQIREMLGLGSFHLYDLRDVYRIGQKDLVRACFRNDSLNFLFMEQRTSSPVYEESKNIIEIVDDICDEIESSDTSIIASDDDGKPSSNSQNSFKINIPF